MSVFDNVWPIAPQDSFDDRVRFALQVASLECNQYDVDTLDRIRSVFDRIEAECARPEWSL